MPYNQKSTQGLTERLIKNAWENKRLASSYLFFGPRGTGRLSLARSLAKTVNCEAGSFPPCLVCSSCRRIERNNYPDVHYLGKQDSDSIKIEQIQQMQREIFLHPFEAKFKVFIILDAEDLTPEAANCLLKILEEPPRDSLIILIASGLGRIFPTIISRCQKIRFHSKDPHEAEIILNRDYHLNRRLSHFLAFVFEGQLGAALKFHDRDILSEKNQIIRQFIPHLFNTSSTAERVSLKEQDKFDPKDKERLDWIIKILISCVRDVYLLKIGADKSELINQDLGDQLRALSKRFSFADLDRMLIQLCNSKEFIRQNINTRLLIDNLRLLWRR